MLSFTLNSDNNFNTSGMNTTSNFQDVDLNNNNNINNNYPSKALASNQKQSMKFNNNNGANGGNNVSTKSKFHGQKSTGNQQQRQQQQGMNSSQNYRKKSVNGMSIPVMSMQSVRESRSPSPTSYTLLNSEYQLIWLIKLLNGQLITRYFWKFVDRILKISSLFITKLVVIPSIEKNLRSHDRKNLILCFLRVIMVSIRRFTPRKNYAIF